MSLSTSQLGSKTSTSWLSRVRQRDPQAWRRLTELYGPLVYHWSRRHSLSAEDASDLTQEVFSAVAGAIERFLHSPEHGTFRGWLWTIARNKLRDHFRRETNREAADGGTAAFQRLAMIPEIWSDESHDVTDRVELQRLFQRALERVRSEFEDRTWRAFWLSTVELRDTSDIAAELGLSTNSVRQAKSRVLRRLRRELGDSTETDIG